MNQEQNYLYSVSAVSSNDIWAVGYYISGLSANYQTLTEHWDGIQWTIVPSPDVGNDTNELFGVSTVSTNDVWAVGYWVNGGQRTLTEHWDGTQWSVVPSPNPPAYGVLLTAVWAASTNDVWTVGDHGGDGDADGILTEHWDGTQWSIVPSPNLGIGHNELDAVSGVSPNDVWAVGYYCCGFGAAVTLAEHWDGCSGVLCEAPTLMGATTILGSSSNLLK